MTKNKNAQERMLQRLQEIRQRGILRREATVGAIDVEARTVELSFSSETEKVQRWFGIEILGHDAHEVKLERLNNKAPALWMHDWNDQRGVIVAGSARIDSDRKGRCIVRFSKSEDGEELFQDIVDGIVTKVSVGYSVQGLKLVEEREDVDVYRITEWTPYEISLVSVAADDDVGVGRSLENPQEDNNKKFNEDSSNATTRTKTMNEKITRDDKGNLVRAKVDESGKIVEVLEMIERAGDADAKATARGADAERARVRSISEMGKQYGKSDLAMQHIAEGKTAEEFRSALLAEFATERSNKPLEEQQRDANIGMTGKEVRSYSIMKAVRALMPNASKRDIDDAKFEFEASRAAAELYGREPKGIIIPNDVLADRAFSTTTGGGNNLIATNLLAGSFIEMLRKRTWVMKRARSLAGLIGNVDIPRQNATGNAYWVGEGGEPSGSNPGVDQIAMTPKTIGAYYDITRRLLKQSTPDAEALVRDDLLKVIALELDRVAIYGSGSEYQPKGLKNYTGINSVDFTTTAKPTFAELVDMETQISLDDADVDAMSYAFNAGIRGWCKTTLKFSAAGSATIWEPGGTVNGYPVDVSNQIATGDVFFGNWMDLIIAMWGGLELNVDTAALAKSGGLRLIALQDVDINLRHVESFCYGANT